MESSSKKVMLRCVGVVDEWLFGRDGGRDDDRRMKARGVAVQLGQGTSGLFGDGDEGDLIEVTTQTLVLFQCLL